MSELSTQMFDTNLGKEIELANKQRQDFAPGTAPLQGGGTIILDEGATMNVFKARVGIFKICELFGIRDDSGLTIRKMNDMKFIKQFGLLEERNRPYLTELIDICESKGVELYNTSLLDEIGYKMKEKELELGKPEYENIDIKAVLTPEVKVSASGNKETKKTKKDMTINMVDIDSLKYKTIEDIRNIYKRVTGKGISPNVKDNKQRFIDKFTELKSEEI